MELPILENDVTKTVNIGEKIFVIRPWKTKEEKNYFIKKSLLSKKQEVDINEVDELMVDALIRPCVLQGDVDDLSFTELKYLMIQIRIISLGEEVEGVIFKCGSCNKTNENSLNFEKEGVVSFTPMKNEFVKISDSMSVKFRSVPYKELTNIKEGKEELFLYFSIEQIEINGKIYTEFTPENFQEFFDSLDIKTTKTIVEKLEECTESLKIVQSYHCMFCGEETKIEFDEMPNFFLP